MCTWRVVASLVLDVALAGDDGVHDRLGRQPQVLRDAAARVVHAVLVRHHLDYY